jgi:hypothetical protein
MFFSNTLIISTTLSLSTLSYATIIRNPPQTHCPSAKILPKLPANQTALAVPAGEKTSFAALGRGVQNYTCSAAGNWTSVGAVAQLFDISCLTSSHNFLSLPSEALKIPFDPHYNASAACGKIQIGKRITLAGTEPTSTSTHGPKPSSKRDFLPRSGNRRHPKPPPAPSSNFTSSLLLDEITTFCPAAPTRSFAYLGLHSFVTFNSTLSPKFDFSASQHKPDYVIAAKVGSLPSPQNSTKDVAWLELAAKDPKGTLAKTVFRTYTAGGQPPAGKCGKVGASLSVDYAAFYYFLN